MTQSPTIGALAAALAAAQGAFAAPKKSHTAKVADKYTYRYSTLDELIEATRAALAAHDLSVVQDVTMPDDVNVAVTTTILHASGEWIAFGPIVLPSGSTPQSAGSAATYGRRYGLGAALNVAAEDDDDGATAQADAQKTAGKPKAAPKSAAPPPREPGDEQPADVAEDHAPITVVGVTAKPATAGGGTFYLVEFSDHKTAWTTDEPMAQRAIDAAQAKDYVVPTIESFTSKAGKKSLKLTALDLA